jgi:hypothetical protein
MSKPSEAKRTASRKPGARPRAQKGRQAAKRARPVAGKAAARVPSRRSTQMWSAAVTRGSNALDLEPSVFAKSSPRAVAQSLKQSAERSRRRKASPYQSAMSMLSFYINRAGRKLPKARLQMLERAKGELRKAFGRD